MKNPICFEVHLSTIQGNSHAPLYILMVYIYNWLSNHFWLLIKQNGGLWRLIDVCVYVYEASCIGWMKVDLELYVN